MVELKSIRHVSDLELPADVTLLTSLEEVVIKIEAPRTLEVPEEVPSTPEAAEAPAAEASAASESEAAGEAVEES
jgi:hypothetical protein